MTGRTRHCIHTAPAVGALVVAFVWSGGVRGALRRAILGAIRHTAMNEFLAAAPHAQVAHGAIGCMVSLDDLCDRPPRKLADGEVIDLGGKRVRHIDTPHVPHNWEARVLFEETTQTLLCGDLFTHTGDGPPLVETDIVSPALEAEARFHATSLSPLTGQTIRRLAALEPRMLALMHGSSTRARCAESLLRLADAYDSMIGQD